MTIPDKYANVLSPSTKGINVKAWEYRSMALRDRILSRVRIEDNGCHIFTGAKDGCGYGRVKNIGTAVATHRWAWQQANGPVPQGMQVLHRCDNPSCINPAHLWLGTHADNMADKRAKGRSHNVPTGRAHRRPTAKISESQAKEIKHMLEQGIRQAKIAAFFGVSRNLISEIYLKKTWAWLDVP